MNELMQEPLRCPKCGLSCEETDNYCRHCGRALKPGRNFFNSHTGIILLALVVGPFALPLVWTSKRIGMVAKILYSVVLLAMGYYLIKACVQIYQLTFQMMQGMMGGF